MRYLMLLVVIITLCGCSLVCDLVPKLCHEPNPQPTPRPTATPTIIDSTPQKIMVDGHAELRIGGKRVAAVGLYRTLTDPSITRSGNPIPIETVELPCSMISNIADYPTDKSIDDEFRILHESGVNLVRIWVMCHFAPGDLVPWLQLPDGKYDLTQFNPAYWERFDRVSAAGDKWGVCIAWTSHDGYCYRLRPDDWAVNPEHHLDNVRPRQWSQENYDSANMFCLSREMWNKHEGYGSRVQWELIQMVADRAKIHKDIVYVWSEMFSDERHRTWDIPAMETYTADAVTRIHTYYPGCITGTSVDRWQSSVYSKVDIADIHGLVRMNEGNRECDPTVIPSAIRALRSMDPNIIYCANSDGCPNSPRETAPWVQQTLQLSWDNGGFAEFKVNSTSNISGVAAGIKAAREYCK